MGGEEQSQGLEREGEQGQTQRRPERERQCETEAADCGVSTGKAPRGRKL